MEYADTTTGYTNNLPFTLGYVILIESPIQNSPKGSSPIKPSIYPWGVETLKIGMRNPVTVLCLAIKGSPICITCHRKMTDAAQR